MNGAVDKEGNKQAASVADSSVTRFSVEGIALTVALILSMLGIGITDVSPLQSYRYWAAMTLILAITSVAIGWSGASRRGVPVSKVLRTQLVHWVATAVAIGGIYLLLKAGRLNYEGTGLVMLIVLGLSTFLDGYRINWHFSLVGLLMFVSSISAAYVEEYLWVLFILATGIVVAVFFWERHKRSKHHQNNLHD